MKQALLQFLQGESQVKYKPFKARVMQVEPLRISEDSKDYLELDSFLTSEETQKFKKSPANYSEVSIEEWHFEGTSDANPQGTPVRLVVQKYKLGKPSGKSKGKATQSLFENDEVRYYGPYKVGD
jgi:hypothetical protein